MKFKRLMLTTIAALMATNTTAYALTYRDVPNTHWAYSAIDKVSDLGYLVGSMSGNFEPNGYVDKFDTVNILAKIAGYKETDATTEEQTFQDNAYEKHKNYINQYSTKFTRWNSVRDRQIAFLLEKEILLPDDLNQFVALSSTGAEQLRALSREEMAVFLVRVMGRREAALAMTERQLYADDARITENYKPYVYYLRSIGIISSADSLNNFAPTTAATRAALAFVLEKVINVLEEEAAAEQPEVSTPQPEASANLETISGTIVMLYPTINAMQLTSNAVNYNNKILRAAASAEITIDGDVTSYAELRAGMAFVGLVSNGELISIMAATAPVAEPETIPPASVLPSPPPTTPSPTNPVPSVPIDQLSRVDGKIVALDQGARRISVEVSMLNLREEVFTEVRTYMVSTEAAITRGGQVIALSEISVGDLLSGRFEGNVLHRFNVDVKDKEFSGRILERNRNTATGLVTLTISDTNGVEHVLRVDSSSKLNRTGFGVVSWDALRVGDDVQVKAEYDRIVELDAIGRRSTIEGTLMGIYIAEQGSFIEFRDFTTGRITKHPMPINLIDVYALRVGSEMRLNLDSAEISSLQVLRQASSTIRGYVSRVSSSTITIRETKQSTVPLMEFRYNDSTIFTDSVVGGRISINNVHEGDLLYVVFDAQDTTLATTVTILGR